MNASGVPADRDLTPLDQMVIGVNNLPRLTKGGCETIMQHECMKKGSRHGLPCSGQQNG
jgi:hypothetical protein